MVGSVMRKRAIVGLVAVALIFMVGALATHALIHTQDHGTDGQQCQICHISHVAAPLPAEQAVVHAPDAWAMHLRPVVLVSESAAVFEYAYPRGPPA
jgi:hypothetical protein